MPAKHARRIRPETDREFRAKVEAIIERLIAVLDDLDGDADFEDGHDAEQDPAESGVADRDALELVLPHYLPLIFPSAVPA